MDVVIYGPKSSSFEYVKLMLQKFLAPSKLPYKIISNHEIDEFINIGIKSVPAVKVNEHVFLEKKQEENINGFIRKVVQSILKEENYGKMKKIIVPIDFSDSSANAYYYAQQLANDFNSIIQIVHVYHPNPVDVQGQVFIDSEVEKIQRKRLNSFVNTVNQDWIGDVMTESLVDGKFIVGFPIPELVRLSKDPTTEFIVMGSKGEDNTFRKFFGSVSSDVAKRSRSPVFVIPPCVSFRPFKNILYATNEPELDSQCLLLTSELAKNYNAMIHIVHVKDSNETHHENFQLIQLMKNRYPKNMLKDVLIEEDSVMDGLNKYVNENQIDLLVMATKKRNFWSGLFHKSRTQEIAITTEIPLMVCHKDDEI